MVKAIRKKSPQKEDYLKKIYQKLCDIENAIKGSETIYDLLVYIPYYLPDKVNKGRT